MPQTPIGSNTWQIRSPHNPQRLFSEPQLLWGAAQEYFSWCDNNPWLKYELLRGGDNAGELITVPVPRVYTIWGFCLYLGVTVHYFSTFKQHHPDDDFTIVLNMITDAIRANKFEGAANNSFNASFIAKDLGMVERRDMTTNGKNIGPQVIINMPGSININLPNNTDGELTDAEIINSSALPPPPNSLQPSKDLNSNEYDDDTIQE